LSSTNYSASRLTSRPTQPKAKQSLVEQVKTQFQKSSMAVRCGVFGCLLMLLTGAFGLHHYSVANTPGTLWPYNLSEDQVQELSRTLTSWNVENTVNAQGNNLLVAPEARANLVIKLTMKGLPHRNLNHDPKSGFPTKTEELDRRKHELEFSLVQCIRSIEGVQDANVELAMAPTEGFEDAPKSSASVFVTMQPDQSLTPEQASGVAHLVAYAVPGLNEEKVAITDNTGRTVARHHEASADSFQLELQKQLDGYLVGKAQALLDSTYGPGMASVIVNAQFDFSQIDIRRTDVGKPGQGETVVVEQKTNEEYVKAQPGDPESGEKVDPKYQKICEAKRVKSDERYTWTVSKVPRVARLTCAVSLAVPKQEDNARKLVSAAIGIDESRGDTLNVASVPRRIHLQSTLPAPPAPPVAAEPASTPPWGMLLFGVPAAALLGLFAVKRSAGFNAMATQINAAQPLQGPCDLTFNSRGQGATRTDLTTTQVQSQLEDLAKARPRDMAEHLRSMLHTKTDH